MARLTCSRNLSSLVARTKTCLSAPGRCLAVLHTSDLLRRSALPRRTAFRTVRGLCGSVNTLDVPDAGVRSASCARGHPTPHLFFLWLPSRTPQNLLIVPEGCRKSCSAGERGVWPRLTERPAGIRARPPGRCVPRSGPIRGPLPRADRVAEARGRIRCRIVGDADNPAPRHVGGAPPRVTRDIHASCLPDYIRPLR